MTIANRLFVAVFAWHGLLFSSLFSLAYGETRAGWSATDGGRIRGPLHVRQGGLR